MSDDAELSISELRRKRAASSSGATSSLLPGTASVSAAIVEPAPIENYVPRRAPQEAPAAQAAAQPKEREFPVDPRRLAEALRRRWRWLAAATAAAALTGGALGFARARCAIPITLTLRDLSPRFVSAGQEGVAYRPPQLSSQTLVNFLTSPELVRDVSARSQPPISEKDLLANLDVNQEKNSETIDVRITGKDPVALVALANLYTDTAVAASKAAQTEDPGEMYASFTTQLAEIEKQEREINSQLGAFRTNSGLADPAVENPAFEREWVDLRIKLDMARGELDLLQKKDKLLASEPIRKRLEEATARLEAYQSQGKRDEHPDVKRVRAEIADLNQQLAAVSGDDSVSGNHHYNPQLADSCARQKSLELEIQQLEAQAATVNGRLQQLYAHTSEYEQLKASLDRLENYRKTLSARRFEAEQYRANAAGYFQTPAPARLADVDTHARYTRATALGLRGGFLGLLASMAVVMLLETTDPRLKTAADVQRITRLPVLATLGDLNKMDEAARRAWAFRTWTILSGTLAQSPNQGTVCGFISAGHCEGRTTWVDLLAGAARERGFEVVRIDFSKGRETAPAANADSAPTSALIPIAKDRSLVRSGAGSVVNIQLPGMLWDLDRRVQFRRELDQCRASSRAVVLVDLPPASVPDSILLAENLPQVIWLADSGRSQSRETRLHLDTLRHARCKLVGAVLNHEPESLISL